MIERPIIIWTCICIALFLIFNIIYSVYGENVIRDKIDFEMIAKVGIIGAIYGTIILFFGLYRHKIKKNNFIYNSESTCQCHKRKNSPYPKCFHCNSQPFSSY